MKMTRWDNNNVWKCKKYRDTKQSNKRNSQNSKPKRQDTHM